jgi:hypothetical protein
MNDSIQTVVSTTSPDLLNGLIYITIILFVLSVITEKITQLVRQYPLQCQIIGLIPICSSYFLIVASFFWPVIGQLPKGQKNLDATDFAALLIINTLFFLLFLINLPYIKHSNKKFPIWFRGQEMTVGQRFSGLLMFRNVGKENVDEKVKEKEISLLSFILGFIIAYLFNANLIELFIHPTKPLGWGDVAPFIGNTFKLNSDFFGFDFTMAIGFIVSGFFLSFGSKFFHDLLDTLLQAKNLKRKLNDPESYNPETIKEFDDFISLTEKEVIQKAILENKSALEKLPNFVSLHLAHDSSGNIACLNISDDNLANIPRKLEYTLPSGKKKETPLRIIPSVGVAKVQIGKVFNPSTPTQIGSIGCALQDSNGTIWLLTCAHVLNGGDFKPKVLQGPIASSQVKYSYNGNTYDGNWVYAFQDSEFDIALFSPINTNAVPQSGLLPQPLKADKITPRQIVDFQGGTSDGHGCVFATNVEEPITFGNGTFRIKGLLKITSSNGLGCISQPGDSGSILYSQNSEAVGLILAANNYFTFAIPVENIIQDWGVKIF